MWTPWGMVKYCLNEQGIRGPRNHIGQRLAFEDSTTTYFPASIQVEREVMSCILELGEIK